MAACSWFAFFKLGANGFGIFIVPSVEWVIHKSSRERTSTMRPL